MILQTKLHRPAITPDLVCRRRLHDRLDAGLAGPGILVAAPAGYGKSMLVSHWAELRPEPCAWLSLDESDSDLRVFLEYLVAALRTAIPGACPETRGLLEAPDLPPVATLAACLANELNGIETRFLLVLDDLQRVSDSEVFELMGVLLEHPPQSLCLVLVTRRDPPLALSRLRARGQLEELRLRDLVFDPSEVEALLEHVAGISIDAAGLANLETELEGWAVGLRLVLLAIANEPDPDLFLSRLRGGTQHVEEYLVEEVLARQSPAVRERLLQTAILDRFCASLCDAVCGGDRGSAEAAIHGRAFIHALVDGGLFTVQLDSQGEWYRYHHLFQRLLRERLESERDTESISALHSRASQWFESQNLVPEAIDHALAAGHATAAAEIVERNRTATADAEGCYELLSWLSRLPDELRRERIGLLMTEAYYALEMLEFGKLAAILDRAEALEADAQESAERSLFRGALSFWNADGIGCVASIDEALASTPEDDSWLRAEAELYRGLALHIAGRSEDASQGLKAAIERNVASRGLVWSRLVAGLAFLRLLRGELLPACQEAARLGEGARRAGSGYVEAWSAYVLGNATLRSFDLEPARQHLGLASSRRSILHTAAALDSVTGLALACQMLGQPEEADRHVAQAREFAQWSNVPENRVIVDACEARIALLRGDLDAAARWQQSFREPWVLPPAIFFMEVPHITECRVLAATADPARLQEASEKLRHLWDGFGALHYTCQQLEIAPLQALVLHRQGPTDEALKALERSFALATPGGWVRPYVELGAPMADLLERLPAEVAESALVRRIHEALRGNANAPPSLSERLPQVDLTSRERDILELLVERLRDKEIAQKLHISPQTVKTHLRTLYRKLDCGDRRRAVERARELGVLP